MCFYTIKLSLWRLPRHADAIRHAASANFIGAKVQGSEPYRAKELPYLQNSASTSACRLRNEGLSHAPRRASCAQLLTPGAVDDVRIVEIDCSRRSPV